MLIRRYEQVEPQLMSMPGARGVSIRVMVGRAEGAPTFAMRVFDVAPGGQTPRHAHNYEHEVIVLEGEGQVFSGNDAGTIRPIRAGDVLFVPANETHQFRNVSHTTLRFACMVPVTFDCGQGQCQATPGT